MSTIVESTPDQPIISCFDDPENYTVKHPLANRWTLWYDAPSKKSQKEWSQNLKKDDETHSWEFNSMEYRMYNYLLNASDLPLSANYHLFKEGIEPAWEDEANSQGGKWSYSVPKNKRNELDEHWLNLMLACIGEQFTHGDEVCGVVVSIRKGGDRLAVWTKNAKDEVKTKQIGTELKAVFGISERMGYVTHEDAASKKSSYAKEAYHV